MKPYHYVIITFVLIWSYINGSINFAGTIHSSCAPKPVQERASKANESIFDGKITNVTLII